MPRDLLAEMESQPRDLLASQPPSPVANTGNKVLRGLMMGGPLGAAAAGVGEGLNRSGEFMDRLAYDAGGKVTDMTGSPELGMAANVATQAIPTVVGAAAGRLAKPVLESTGRFFMQSALKPSKAARDSGKAVRAVDTMLKEGFNVSKGGVEKMQTMVDDLNNVVDDIVKNSNSTVDRDKVVNYLQDVVKKFENRPDALEAQKAVEKAWEQFVTHPMVSGSKQLPMQTAQQLKRGYQASVGDKGYGDLKTAATESEKAIARGLRTEMAAGEPGIVDPLAREAGLINAKKLANDRVLAAANRDVIGIGAILSQPWMLPIWMWDRSPLLKSLLARGLYSGSGPLSTGAGAAAGGMYGAQQGQPPSGILYP
jgi:hypothetical protein